jgi:hypothetical protein
VHLIREAYRTSRRWALVLRFAELPIPGCRSKGFRVRCVRHHRSDAMPTHLAQHYELAYEEAKRALDAQEAVVDELRSRAAVLIAAAAVTTSFFGTRALTDSGNLDFWAWAATISFALLGMTVLAILWPRHDWVFTVNASTFIENYVEHPDGALEIPTIHRDLALHMSASYSVNAGQLRWLFVAFRAGAALLVAEVTAWVVNLSVGA